VNFANLYRTFAIKERRLFTGAAITLIAAASLWGISVFYSTTVAEPVEGGSYVEAIIGQPATINPLILSDNDADRDLVELLFADLSELTETHKTNADQTIWNFVLRKNLLWSDGEPLTSDDVIFTIQAIQNSAVRSSLYSSWQGVIAERLGELEVRFTIRNPYVFFFDNTRRLKIVPKHIFGAIPFENLRLSDYNLEPIGSGPYMFQGFKKRKDGFIEEYRLVANPRSVLATPLIKNITLRFFEKKTDALTALATREVQGLGGLTIADLEKIQVSHQIFTLKIPQYYALFFNQTISSTLKEKPVREALAYATDKKKLVETIFADQAAVADGPLPGLMADYISATPEKDFNLETAKDILETAGWKIPDDSSDGIRAKIVNKNPLRLAFEMVVPRVPFLVQTANAVKEDWKKIGIETNLIILDPTEVVRTALKTRNYQILLFGNILNDNPDIFSFWHSSQRFYPGLNLALYENREVDDLLETIRQNPDPIERNRGLVQLQEQIRADQPALFLYTPFYLYAGPKNFGGMTTETIVTPAERFRNAEKWYLKTARIFK